MILCLFRKTTIDCSTLGRSGHFCNFVQTKKSRPCFHSFISSLCFVLGSRIQNCLLKYFCVFLHVRAKGQSPLLFLRCHHLLFFEIRSLTDPKSPIFPRLAATGLQELPVSPVLGLEAFTTTPGFSRGFWDLNSGIYGFKGNTLLTELSSWLTFKNT